MSCPNNSVTNNLRNIGTAEYKGEKYRLFLVPNQPFVTRPYLSIDPRQVRITPDPLATVDCVNNPDRIMRFSYGCTDCIRNEKVIFSP